MCNNTKRDPSRFPFAMETTHNWDHKDIPCILHQRNATCYLSTKKVLLRTDGPMELLKSQFTHLCSRNEKPLGRSRLWCSTCLFLLSGHPFITFPFLKPAYPPPLYKTGQRSSPACSTWGFEGVWFISHLHLLLDGNSQKFSQAVLEWRAGDGAFQCGQGEVI